jgi:hypothetical protein
MVLACGGTGVSTRTRRLWMSETSFDRVITEHLTLSERNRGLERTMPLDRYREQCGGEIANDPLPRRPPPPGNEEPPTEVNAAPPGDPDSWWDTRDGECPPPPLAWNGDC